MPDEIDVDKIVEAKKASQRKIGTVDDLSQQGCDFLIVLLIRFCVKQLDAVRAANSKICDCIYDTGQVLRLLIIRPRSAAG